MKMKKFLVIGVMSLLALTGCSASDQPAGSSSTPEAAAVSKQAVEESESITPEKQEPAPSEQAEASVEEGKAAAHENAKKQLQTLAGFIGQTAHDVNLVLGQPSTSKNIQDSKLLAANYYKIDFCNEVARVEADFDVDSQKVNYVSFTIMAADDIEGTKETFINVLTELYGESTIERFMDVKGKQRRDWNDGTLDYDLKYYENNITLDIYPLDK